MNHSTTDRIVKKIELRAPVSKVWLALTDYRQFGQWFRVKLEGPFVAGGRTRGHITYPGYEHLIMDVAVVTIQPEHLFSFHWHPYAIELGKDYSAETPTLVEFVLDGTKAGTLLTVTESGFDALPPGRRDEAFRMNDGGWEVQMQNIEAYVSQSA